jgi:hypothetical protein
MLNTYPLFVILPLQHQRLCRSAKFSIFVLLSILWGAGFRAVFALVLPNPSKGAASLAPSPLISSGPLELLFALLMFYFKTVPKLVPAYFSVFGLKFSDKSIMYALALQLCCSNGFASITPSVSGAVFGLLYMWNVARIQSLSIPKPIRAVCAKYIAPWWESEAPHVAETRVREERERRERAEERREEREGQAEMQQIMQAINSMEGNRRPGPRAAPPTAPAAGIPAAAAPSTAVRADPAALERLIAMGFGRGEATQALQTTNNDETAAANMLLEA